MYKSLYRIFRPKKFSDSIGQEYIVKILKNQLTENKVGHAYLFTGVRGTGKTTFAKILAKAVNCLNLKDGEPCLECENCIGIEDGSILDVIEMDAASNTGVDNIRDIIEESNYLPTKANCRVYIIDEVHMLSTGAFNALLKTLEEPPAHVKFILATTEPQKLPATILSRCQRFDFKKVSIEELAKHLKNISDQSNIDITDEALNLIATLAEGSVRDSISLLESAKSLEGKIDEASIRNIIGIPSVIDVIQIVKEILNGNNKGIEIALDILNEGKDSKVLLEEIIKILEVAMLKEPELISKYSKEEKHAISEIANKDKEDIYFFLKSTLDLENNLRWTEKKNRIFIAKLIELSMYFSKEEKTEESSMNPEDIINILKGDDSKKTNNIDIGKVNYKKEEKKVKETKKNIEQSINKKEINEQNIMDITENNKNEDENINLVEYSPFNIINIQKNLTRLGEMQIFVLVSNSDAYINENKLLFVKKKNYEANKNTINKEHAEEVIKNIMKNIENKEYEVELKGW